MEHAPDRLVEQIPFDLSNESRPAGGGGQAITRGSERAAGGSTGQRESETRRSAARWSMDGSRPHLPGRCPGQRG